MELMLELTDLITHRRLGLVQRAGGLAEGVFESELFGHVKGAFTDARTDRIGRFELADRGTIFLDEIGNVPFRQQAKLLRAIESGEIERVGSSRSKKIDARVISATNSDLKAACEGGQFREDLLFRLNTVEVHLPALRERREDIPALAMHFLSHYALRYRCQVKGIRRPCSPFFNIPGRATCASWNTRWKELSSWLVPTRFKPAISG